MSYQWTFGPQVEVPGYLDKISPYNPRSREHFWLMITAFKVEPARWAKGTAPMLDRENIVNVSGPACFYCELEYTPQLAQRACRGEPK